MIVIYHIQLKIPINELLRFGLSIWYVVVLSIKEESFWLL